MTMKRKESSMCVPVNVCVCVHVWGGGIKAKDIRLTLIFSLGNSEFGVIWFLIVIAWVRKAFSL